MRLKGILLVLNGRKTADITKSLRLDGLNCILRKYVVCGMPARKVEMIPITKHIMTEILRDNGQRISHWLGNGK